MHFKLEWRELNSLCPCRSEWRELNWLLVGFGQQKCLPNAPKCKGCLNEEICPASKLKNGGPWGRKKKAVKRERVETN